MGEGTGKKGCAKQEEHIEGLGEGACGTEEAPGKRHGAGGVQRMAMQNGRGAAVAPALTPTGTGG